jgi:Aldo/keto reductase family
MIDRLIFGTGHLTGGASQKTSHQLISRCLDTGLRHFDTAPGYGLGTAELALGLSLRRDGRAALINTKVGLPRPYYGVLKSYMRAVKRILIRRHTAIDTSPPQAETADLRRGRFDPAGMAQSLTDSLNALGVPSVETLFLHEAYADNLSPGANAFLMDARAQGLAKALGIANGALFDPALASLVPPDFVIQSAAPPDFFDGRTRSITNALAFHTIIRSFFWKLTVDRHLKLVVDASCQRFKGLLGDDPGAVVAVGYILLAAAAPKAKLIYTTTAPRRLQAFLSAMRAITREKATTEIARFVWERYHSTSGAPRLGSDMEYQGYNEVRRANCGVYRG